VLLEGVVLWTCAAQDELILQDETGGIWVDVKLRGQPAVRTGEHVRLEGSGIAGFDRLREVLVDNDGLHGKVERSETIYLPAGRHPIRVSWFNRTGPFGLEVQYEGPDLARQPIPSAAIFRAEAARDGTTNLVHGLEYRCYEGNWDRLPDFDSLPVVKTGTTTNFDLNVRTRDEAVGLRFTGYVELPREGLYTFWTASDDGSRLYIGESALRLRRLGSAPMPAPRRIPLGQAVPEVGGCDWAQVEGPVTFVHANPSGGLELQLGAGTNCLYLDVDDVANTAPAPFSRIRATGVCCGTGGPGGQQAARMIVPSMQNIELLAEPPGSLSPKSTALAQLRRLAASHPRNDYAVRLEGLILSTSPERGLLAFQDDSAAALVELAVPSQALRPGQRVALTGDWTVAGPRLTPRNAPLVNNDGVHGMEEKSGAIYLTAGKQPLSLSWFNLVSPLGLEVHYEGPDLPRQKVRASALVRAQLDPVSGAPQWVKGLGYRRYEGAWVRVPNWTQLNPVMNGIGPNFDVSLAGHSDDAGLAFSGYLDVPCDGVYTFSTISDDGSLLFLGQQPPCLEITGTNALPDPQRIAARQILRKDQQDRWSEVEGTVTFVNEQAGSLELELSSGTGRMRLEAADGSGGSRLLLLNSRIRARGICQSTYTTDGQQVAGTLLVPTMRDIELLEVAPGHWVDVPIVPIVRLADTNSPMSAETVVHVRGKVLSRSPGASLTVADETGQVFVETSQTSPAMMSEHVEALGRWSRAGTNIVLRCAACREVPLSTPEDSKRLPLLTTIEQVKRLSREEAGRGYPVKIRGVITAPQIAGFFIQDSTWSIYVRLQDPAATEPQHAGDYWEVEGVTFAEFAPNVSARRAVRLGTGTLPEPLHPTWDQLINGSLDTQYVEVRGIVTAVEPDGMALLTPAGKIKVQLSDVEPGTLKRYENALVRLRGCVIPGRDETTQQVELGRLRLSNFSVNVDEPAPADPFTAPPKRARDLLLFDSRAGAIQRVKIAGQVLHERGGECYLMDGTNGLRFIPKEKVELSPGELVDVVGFPELGGPSPVLREAVVRQTGQAPLPLPQPLPADALIGRQHDARLVRVEARLTGLSLDGSGQALELQAGKRGFLARLDTRRGALRGVSPGSRLELTGVYAGQGGDLASGREIDSFELLLNSPADIRVLERPPWWTLRHTLTVVGGMACLILIALVWITQLRRQVEERSRQLTAEIQRREQTERQRALEGERARIARDLHDDLGATLTQIRLLSALESRDAQVPETTRTRLNQVTEKSREMVASLDEIVWAVNPANDSLPSLATYLCQFAEEFLRPTPIRCRLDVDDSLPPVALTSEVRHHLYLAVREALNNIAKHSQASEVWLRIQWREHSLAIALEDNGRGFAHLATVTSGDGLSNMRRRLEQIGGRFECQTQPGAGTVCRIWLPLDEQPIHPFG
jgi:signal transduction histidine kinase